MQKDFLMTAALSSPERSLELVERLSRMACLSFAEGVRVQRVVRVHPS
jgi:hypothetical protein